MENHTEFVAHATVGDTRGHHTIAGKDIVDIGFDDLLEFVTA
jgi:hypothetical protein